MDIPNLLQFLSISSRTNDDLGNPNISGTDRAGEFVREMLKDLPLNWTKIQKTGKSGFWYAETVKNDPTKPIILLSSHIDTVYAAEEIEVRETEDKIYGSGAQDMKGSVFIICEILKELNKQNKLQNIIFYISPQEETATLDYREEIEKLSKKANYAMVFESTMDSYPEGTQNQRSLVTSRKGFDMFDLEIEGPGGHSGVITRQQERHSSILAAARIVNKLEELADYEKETTFNTGFFHGGDAVNVLATSARISFETRFRTTEEYDRVKEDIAKVLKTNIQLPLTYKLKSHKFYPPFDTNKKEVHFVELCKEVANSLNISIVSEKRGGGSEASLIKYYNPECAVLDGLGLRGDGQHTKNEFIYKYSLQQTFEFGYKIIERILG